MQKIHEHYSADKPVENESEDRFQRYPFAKRISKTIIDRKSHECLVIGINGVWGEGKSSVLNFLETELIREENIEILHFNPWRYGNEDALLKSFFYKIGDVLGKKLGKQAQKIASYLSKYGSGNVLNYGFNLGNIAKVFADVEVEQLKRKINEHLEKSEKRLVVFIDDIDRLDKDEVYALFRLLKLTGDFSNTTYVLSFDKNMVSAAISERFGKGEFESGESFLEKIIQVPLNLPKAQSETLTQYCVERIKVALAANQIELSTEDADRFELNFKSYVVTRLNTPRMAVRYANAISFSVPLMNGEVNIADLMLLEAIKVFYPRHYDFIKQFPDYFLSSYREGDIFSRSKPDEKKELFKSQFDKFSSDLNSKEKQAVQRLIIQLFPILEDVYHNYSYSNDSIKLWTANKRICSHSYFERYFTYTVQHGEISDVVIDQFLRSIDTSDSDEITKSVSQIISTASDIKFLQKLHNLEEHISWSTGKKLFVGIMKNENLLTKEGSPFNFRLDAGFNSFAMLVYRFLSRNSDSQELFPFAKELLSLSTNYTLASDLKHWYLHERNDGSKLFDDNQEKEFEIVLFDIVETSIDGNEDILDKYPNEASSILKFWSDYQPERFNEYLENYLNNAKENILKLLGAFTPIITSTAFRNPYKGDLQKDNYEYIVSFIDKEDILERVLICFKEQELMVSPEWVSRKAGGNDALNLCRQFYHWYNMDSQN